MLKIKLKLIMLTDPTRIDITEELFAFARNGESFHGALILIKVLRLSLR